MNISLYFLESVLYRIAHFKTIPLLAVTFLVVFITFFLFVFITSLINVNPQVIGKGVGYVHKFSNGILISFMAFFLVSNLNNIINLRQTIYMHNNDIIGLYMYNNSVMKNSKYNALINNDIKLYINDLSSQILFLSNNKEGHLINNNFYKLLEDLYKVQDSYMFHRAEDLNDDVSKEVALNKGLLDGLTASFLIVLVLFNLLLESILMQFNDKRQHKILLIFFKSFVLSFFLFMIFIYHRPISGLSANSVDTSFFYKTQSFINSGGDINIFNYRQ